MLRRFFYLQKSDRRIMLALLVVAVVALTVLWLTGSWQPPTETTAADSTATSKRTAAPRYQPRPIDEGGPERPTALFDFDPNTADSTALLNEGKYVVTWAFNFTPDVDNWRAGIVSALEQYSAGVTDWGEVEYAFVEGRATAYANTH